MTASLLNTAVFKMSRRTDFRNFVEALSYSAVHEISKRGPFFTVSLPGRAARTPVPPSVTPPVFTVTLLSCTTGGNSSAPALTQQSLPRLEWEDLLALSLQAVLMNRSHWDQGCAS